MHQSENDRPSATCPLCGRENRCVGAQGIAADVRCWCTNVVVSSEALARVPLKDRNRNCICARCAAEP